MKCEHKNFDAKVAVNRIEDIGRFVAEVTLKCTECNTPFQFIGLPPGIDYNGATAGLDGLTAHLGVCPQGEQPTPLQGLLGYTVNRVN